MSVASFSFNLPPKAAMEYLASKGQKLSFDYNEMMHDAHHRAFTVAKVTKLDLLSDIHESLKRAQAEGIPFEQWKKELKPTLQKAGWWGETSVTNPATGEVRDIYVGSRRLRTIYYTNMRVSQAVGRYKEMMGLPLSVYWKYHAIKDGKTRPSHLALDGMVRHRDDPVWKRIYPPNDYFCRCFVTAHSKRECEKNGWKISSADEPLPEGFEVHPDWDYDVGAGTTNNLEMVEFQKTVKALKGNTTDAEVTIFKEVQALFLEKGKTTTLCTSTIFGKEKSVKLSSQTVQSHLHHKEITALDYSLIPLMLDGDKRVFAQSDTKYIVLTKLGVSYRLTLKDITNKNEIYTVSLVNLGSNLDSEIKKLSKFEEVQD